MSVGLPEGYRAVEAAGVRGFAWSAAAPWLESVIREAGTLEDWATARAVEVLRGGRAPVTVVPAEVGGPDGRARWALRRFRRGGAAAFLGDRYLCGGDARPVAELRASAAARARGVRTPAIVAGAVYRSGPFYRADLVTELVTDARTLASWLFGDGPRAGVHATLSSAGRLVRSLEHARVLHRDLNAGNILVRSDAGGAEPWVIDLDRCRVLPAGGPAPGDAMRRRLERSLEKLGNLHRRPLTSAEWESLRAGFEEHE